jgi:hypothetical protein
MRARVLQFVGLVLLLVIVVSVVSPCFDLHPTTLRTSRRGVTPYSFAVLLLLTHLPSFFSVAFMSTRVVQSPPQTHDIVARDCARLC